MEHSQKKIFAKLEYISSLGRAVLFELIKIAGSHDSFQLEQIASRSQPPPSGVRDLAQLIGIWNLERYGWKYLGDNAEKFTPFPEIRQIAVEISGALYLTEQLDEEEIKLIARTGARVWRKVTGQVIKFLEYWDELIKKVHALRREIEHNSGDSLIRRLNVNSSEGVGAVLVGHQLGEYSDDRDVGDEISVSIYLDTNDNAVQQDVVKQVRQLVNVLGYKEDDNPNIQSGSLFRKSWARLSKGLESTEVRERLIKMERALEIALIDERQANTDSKEAQAVEQLLRSLESVTQACMRVGSILLIKYQSSQGPVILVRNLSQLEIRAFEQFPEIQQNPQKVLQSLSLVLSQLDEHAAPQPDR